MSDSNIQKEIIRVIGPSIAYVPLSRGLHSLIDADDVELVSTMPWRAKPKNPQKHLHYAAGGKWKNGKRPTVYLHRFILGSPKHTDHINGNGLDNRRANLRAAEVWQNQANKIVAPGLSGFRGVHKYKNRWRAALKAQGIIYRLGNFDTPEEAYSAYCDAAKRLHGEFARIA